MSENDLPASGDIRQIPIRIDCPKCDRNCTILEICAIIRGGEFAGMSIGYACMYCGHIDEWYATAGQIEQELYKPNAMAGHGDGKTGKVTIH